MIDGGAGGKPPGRVLSGRGVHRMLELARRRRFRRGEVVFHEGDRADTIHLVESGHVASQTTTEEGGTVTYRIFGPGDLLGLLGLQSGDPTRYGTAVALEPAVTQAISAEQLRAVSWADPEMTQMIVDLLASEIRTFAAGLVEALFVPVETRVLRRIIALSEMYGQGAQGATVPLTQSAVADLAGTSRATVNRVMKSLEEVGLIQRRRSAFTVLDTAALAHAVRNNRQLSR